MHVIQYKSASQQLHSRQLLNPSNYMKEVNEGDHLLQGLFIQFRFNYSVCMSLYMGIKINVQACTCNWGDLIWVFHGSCFPRDFYIFHFLSSLWFAGVCRSFYEVCSVHNYSDDQTNLFSSVVSCIHCMVHGYSLYHTWDLYDLNHTAE